MIEVVHIVARVTTDMTRFNAGMASMEAKAKTATAKMSLAGMRMTKYLTLPIAGIGYAAVKMSTQFGAAMTQIQTQAGAPAKDLPKIKKALLAMSGKDVMQGPVDLAQAYYHLQSVFGKTATVAKKLDMLKNIGQLSQIGGSNIEDTTSAVAGILRTQLTGAKTVEQVVRTINGIVGSGNMRMPQFVESTGTAVLQVAKLLHMSLKDVGSAEALFTDENMNANMSMTRLRTSLMMAIHPSQAAAKSMALLGVTSLAIGTKMRGPNGFGHVLDYLGERYDAYVKKLEDQGKSDKVAKTMASAALFGSFGGSKGASVWATLVQQRTVFHQKHRQITEQEKKYNKDLAASSHTMQVQFSMAWSRMRVALIEFGDALAPVVLGAAKQIAKLADAFTGLPQWVKKWIMGIALGLAALGPGLIIMSSLMKIMGDFKFLFAGAEGGISLLPIALLLAVGAMVYFAYKSKKFRHQLEVWGKAMQGFFHWLGFNVIGPFFYRLYRYFEQGGKASRWNTIVVPAIKAVGKAFKESFGYIAFAIKTDWKLLMRFENFVYKWAGRIAGALIKVNNALGLPGLGPTQHLSGQAKAAIGRLHAKAVAKGMTDDQYSAWVGRQRLHDERHTHAGGLGHHHGAMVNVEHMHVRHESDAEIVAARIHRRVVTR